MALSAGGPIPEPRGNRAVTLARAISLLALPVVGANSPGIPGTCFFTQGAPVARSAAASSIGGNPVVAGAMDARWTHVAARWTPHARSTYHTESETVCGPSAQADAVPRQVTGTLATGAEHPRQLSGGARVGARNTSKTQVASAQTGSKESSRACSRTTTYMRSVAPRALSSTLRTKVAKAAYITAARRYTHCPPSVACAHSGPSHAAAARTVAAAGNDGRWRDPGGTWTDITTVGPVVGLDAGGAVAGCGPDGAGSRGTWIGDLAEAESQGGRVAGTMTSADVTPSSRALVATFCAEPPVLTRLAKLPLEEALDAIVVTLTLPVPELADGHTYATCGAL